MIFPMAATIPHISAPAMAARSLRFAFAFDPISCVVRAQIAPGNSSPPRNL
jgi:hypothetical protein